LLETVEQLKVVTSDDLEMTSTQLVNRTLMLLNE